MRPDLASVHTSGASEAAVEPAGPRAEAAEMAEISAADFILRKPLEVEEELTGTGLRRRFAASVPEEEPAPEKKGLLSRLFRRGQTLDEAA
jgi:hypothetical protein